MKLRPSIALALIFGLLVLLLAVIAKRPSSETSSTAANAESSGSPSNTAIDWSARGSGTSPQVSSPTRGAGSNVLATAQRKADQIRQALSIYNEQPIVFYGKLVDQFDSAVANAHVDFSVRVVNGSQNTTERGRTVSDSAGLFSISGYKGQDLSVNPSKQGYVPGGVTGAFTYSRLSPEDERIHPDPGNPIVIRMWKTQGGERLLHFQTETSAPIDGTAVQFDLITGKKVESRGDLIIRVESTSKPSIQERYDWRVFLQAVDGGLIASIDDFDHMFQAPELGYQPNYQIAFTKGAKPWSTTFNGVFYLKSRDGSCYGKIAVEVLSDVVKDGMVTVILDSYLNPAGSRNLEVDPKLVVAARP